MKNIYLYLLFTTLILLVASCERIEEVDIYIPYEGKNVFNAYLTPNDSVIHAFLSLSTPAVNQENNYDTKWITDAQVSISDGVNEVALMYNPDNFQYESLPNEFAIAGGKTYSAKILTSDGKSTQTSCTVPVAFGPQVTIKVDSVDVNTDIREVHVKVNWNDDGRYKNYYRVVGQAYVVEDISGFYDTSYLELSPEGSELMLSDEGANGATLSTQLSTQFNPTLLHIAKVQVRLLVCDENYFKYHQGVGKGVLGSLGGEPVFVYSNIPGGLGAFGAYNELIITDKWLR